MSLLLGFGGGACPLFIAEAREEGHLVRAVQSMVSVFEIPSILLAQQEAKAVVLSMCCDTESKEFRKE